MGKVSVLVWSPQGGVANPARRPPFQRLIFSTIMLVASWVAVLIAVGGATDKSPGVAVACFFVQGTTQFVWGWWVARRFHRYSLSGLHLYVVSFYIFYVVAPSLSVASGIYYTAALSPERNTAVFMALSTLSEIVFVTVYIAVVRGSQLVPLGVTPVRAIYARFRRSKRKHLTVTLGGALFLITGLLAFFFMYGRISGEIFDYSQTLMQALRGYVWLMLLGELVGVGGLVFLAHGQQIGSKSRRRVGWVLVCLYILLMALFRKRLQALQYLVVAVLYLQLRKDRRLPRAHALAGVVVAFVLILVMPTVAVLRAGVTDWGLILERQPRTFFLDYNFAEVPATLIGEERLKPLGVWEGAKHALGQFVPRNLWPEKPEALAVMVTAAVMDTYDATNLRYGLALTYFGTGYVIFGNLGIFFLTAVIASVMGFVVRGSRRAIRAGLVYLPLLGCTVIYHLGFYVLKDDLVAASVHMIVPVVALGCAVLVERVRVRR